MKYRIIMIVDADNYTAMDEMAVAISKQDSDPLMCLVALYEACHMSCKPIQIEIEKEDG